VSIPGAGAAAISTAIQFGPGVNVPAGFDWSTPHKYGFLWVPATANAMGYAEMFLDDVQVGPSVYWDQYHPASPRRRRSSMAARRSASWTRAIWP
jgi:hypothetical protein